MKRKAIIFKLLLSAMLIMLSALSINALTTKERLSNSRDSLELLLKRTPKDDVSRQVVLLNHICDIDIEFGDTAHLYPCWFASVKAHDVQSMDDLLIPLAMRAMKRGQADSVKVWEKRARENFSPSLASCNIEYIKMMGDISDWEHKDQLAKRMLKERLSIDPKKRPYEAMRILYTMGILASFETFGNNVTRLKSSEEYMVEALQIAYSRPFDEAFHFTRQILLGLSAEKIEYGKQYLEFVNKLYKERYNNRPFYSRRSLVTAYDKLILMGASLPRTELDGYYSKLSQLIKEFPNSTPIPLPYFTARLNFRYNKLIKNKAEALRWCDSLINAPAQYHQSPLPYYEDKAEILASMNRWEEAYNMERIYCAAKDSMQSVNSATKLEELQTQYDVDTLKRKEEARRQQLIISILIGALVLCVLCSYVMYSRRMAAKNKILLKQLREHVEHLTANNVAFSEHPSASADDVQAAVKPETENIPVNSAAKNLFGKLDKIMREEQLYLNPELGRNELVSRLGTNKNNLTSALSAGGQHSLLEYINEFRLNDSLLLMEKHPDMPLTQVAESAGFAVYSSFYRAFCKRFGVNPAEYRRFTASR